MCSVVYSVRQFIALPFYIICTFALDLLQIMPNIESFGKNSVKFKNGKAVEIDAVLFTTGFLSTCSFLDEPEAIPFPGAR